MKGVPEGGDVLYTANVRVFGASGSAGKLYLIGGHPIVSWVVQYFGSDVSPFPRRRLLRVS